MAGSTTGRRLAALALLLSAGILAGAQLGKIAPLAGWYREEAGYSLALVGWLTSLIGSFVALAALPAGLAIERIGVRPSFIAGSAILIAGGVWLGIADTPAEGLAARLVEGIGYLSLCIAIPALLDSIAPEAWRGPALAIWGGFVPIGFAAADLLGASMLPESGGPTYLLTIVAAFAVPALAAAMLVALVSDREAAGPRSSAAGSFRATLTLPVKLIALSFGAYVVLSVGFFAFMPVFSAEEGSKLLLSPGLIALVTPIGNLLAGILVAGRSPRFVIGLAGFGFLAAIVGAPLTFATQGAVGMTLGAALLAFSFGLIASALFAVLPFILGPGASVAVAIGYVAQAGGLATVFGPPVAGHVIETFGWPAFSAFAASVGVAGLLLLVPLLSTPRAARRQAA